MDGMVVTSNDPREVSSLKTHLAKEFEIKDLGSLCYFLGIEVARSHSGIFISQRKYVLGLLQKTGMLGCRPVDIPYEFNHKLGIDVGDPVDKQRSQRLVGKLNYLPHARPNIAYAVGIMSHFMHNPQISHLETVHRILSYLKSAPEKWIFFPTMGI